MSDSIKIIGTLALIIYVFSFALCVINMVLFRVALFGEGKLMLTFYLIAIIDIGVRII